MDVGFLFLKKINFREAQQLILALGLHIQQICI